MFLNVIWTRYSMIHEYSAIQGRAETFGGAGAQNIKGAHAWNKALNRAVHKIS